MYHPYLLKMCGGSPDYVKQSYLQTFKEALADHNKIMSVSWGHLDYALPQIGGRLAGWTAGDAYEFGWEHNSNTKLLHKIFEDMVSFAPKKDLKDYM